MGKVSIKKNIKPKKITTKKTVKPKKKVIKDKDKDQTQTQTQNVIVNVSEEVKKKRGRPTKRSKIEKQKPASQQPITQSYNQPIFKQSIPQQPSNLASSILASQNTPKVIKEEAKEESAIKKALIDQNISTEEPETKANDLERVRSERLKKFEKPKIEIIKEEPIRHALLSQILSDQQDDTEEINALKFNEPEKQSIGTQTETFERKFRVSLEPPEDFESLKEAQKARSKKFEILKQRKTITVSDLTGETSSSQPAETIEVGTESLSTTEQTDTERDKVPAVFVDAGTKSLSSTDETPLKQPEERGAIDLTTTSDISEPTPLTLQPTLELGFGGLTEEPVQTSVGQFLPPEPVSQNELIKKKSTNKLPSLLKAVEPPPPITQAQETEPLITEQLREGDQYVTETLVKDKPSTEAKELKPSDYIKAKWRELSAEGLLEGFNYTFTNKKGESQVRPSKLLLDEILSVDPSFEVPESKKTGAKIKK